MNQIHGNLPPNPRAEAVRDLPYNLYFAKQVRELDRLTIQEEGILGLELMERAGAAAFSEIRHLWSKLRVMGVLCGAGNNGGDGFVVARLAHEAGYNVPVWQLGDCDIGGDAYSAREKMEAAGLVAQGLPLNQAAHLGVCLHARAGDLAAEKGQRGLLASDLFPYLRELLG